MKVGAAQWGGILRDLSRYAGLLLHGDDAGLVRAQALTAAKTVVPSLDDPFLAAVLAKDEHGRLLEEVSARSMIGGRRVVRVLDAGDALTHALSRIAHADGALVVVEAGALAARSKLRQAAEKSPLWASMACYPAEGSTLTASIKRAASSAGYRLAEDAALFLTRELGGDTQTRQSELEKLFLYAGRTDLIDIDMAMECCAPGSETSVNALLTAVMEGNVALGVRLLHQITHDGVTGPALITALNGRLQRVLRARLDLEGGRNAEEAVRGLMPPVFFRDVAGMVRDVQRWSESALRGALGEARMADVACKRAGSRDVTIASQVYLTIARRVARQRSLRAAEAGGEVV